MPDCVPLRREMLGQTWEIKAEVADFAAARRLARAQAQTVASDPMLLAWYDRRRGRSSPQLDCCREDLPAWLAYALNRGANLIINVNQEEYIFCFRCD